MFTHFVDGAGANFTWPKPFAALAVIDPEVPVVVSFTTACRPFGVSCSWMLKLSPWLRNSTLLGSGVPEAIGEKSTGLAGPCDLPLWVRYAKFAYSTPTRSWQVVFRC